MNIGDLVDITLNGITQHYYITFLDLSQSTIGISQDPNDNDMTLLTRDQNNNWNIQNTTENYIISLNQNNLSQNNLSRLSKDMKYEILFNLDDSDLFNMCQVNQEYRGLCSNDDFWRMKLDEKYPSASKVVMPGEYRKLYLQFYDLVKNGHVNFNDVKISNLQLIVRKDYVNVMRWLDSIGQLDQLKYDIIARDGLIEGKIGILDWLASKNYHFDASYLKIVDQPKTVGWLLEHVNVDQRTLVSYVDYMLLNKHYPAVKVFLEKNIKPSAYIVDIFLSKQDLKSANWAISHGILPTVGYIDGIKNSPDYQNIAIIKFLKDKNLI